MHTGRISLADVGPFDLQSTVESGQSYLWDRLDGRMYESDAPHGGDAWYVTTARTGDGPGVVRVRQTGDELAWQATFDADAHLRERLRLDDDLHGIRATAPAADPVASAFDRYWGMRLVNDPPFPSLVSFICSAQMRVARIHGMQRALRRAFGEHISFDGETYHAYPIPEALASTTEERLRDLGLGYRAPYVRRTAEMVADGTARPAAAAGREYEDAREYLTRFVGVGRKVADCVCLFALGHLQAIPLDTWIRSAIEEHFPECDRGSYEETSRALRARFGGAYAGYVQTYVFHHLRTAG